MFRPDNSALALHEDGHDIGTLLAQVQRWYQVGGLPPTVQVPLSARSDLRYGGAEFTYLIAAMKALVTRIEGDGRGAE